MLRSLLILFTFILPFQAEFALSSEDQSPADELKQEPSAKIAQVTDKLYLWHCEQFALKPLFSVREEFPEYDALDASDRKALEVLFQSLTFLCQENITASTSPYVPVADEDAEVMLSRINSLLDHLPPYLQEWEGYLTMMSHLFSVIRPKGRNHDSTSDFYLRLGVLRSLEMQIPKLDPNLQVHGHYYCARMYDVLLHNFSKTMGSLRPCFLQKASEHARLGINLMAQPGSASDFEISLRELLAGCDFELLVNLCKHEKPSVEMVEEFMTNVAVAHLHKFIKCVKQSEEEPYNAYPIRYLGEISHLLACNDWEDLAAGVYHNHPQIAELVWLGHAENSEFGRCVEYARKQFFAEGEHKSNPCVAQMYLDLLGAQRGGELNALTARIWSIALQIKLNMVSSRRGYDAICREEALYLSSSATQVASDADDELSLPAVRIHPQRTHDLAFSRLLRLALLCDAANAEELACFMHHKEFLKKNLSAVSFIDYDPVLEKMRLRFTQEWKGQDRS